MLQPTTDELIDFLKSVPIFSSVDERTLERIVDNLDWIELSPGEYLFREGDPSDKLYLIVFGRLRAVVESDEERTVVGELTRGEYVGEMGFITDKPRSSDIEAARESYLVSVDREAFETLIQEHPEQLTNISELLINRLRQTIQPEQSKRNSNFFAFVPLSETVDPGRVIERVLDCFNSDQSCKYLDEKRRRELFYGPGDGESLRTSDFLEWLYRHEENDQDVFMACDSRASSWNRTVLRNADRVFLLAPGDESAELRPVEQDRLLDPDGEKGTQTELILLWPESQSKPEGTDDWIEKRTIQQHFHLRGQRSGDYERLARFLQDEAVGIALGGGGARGLAHAGVLQALREEGVPLDYVVGTSIGALIGALWVDSGDVEDFRETLQNHFLDRESLLDYTVPLVSFCRGRTVTNLVDELFGERRIEDLPEPFSCLSTDLTQAETRIHESGYLRKWILASVAIPIIGPPVLQDGNLLVDGGVLNNLPVDIVQERVNGPTLAVNVSPTRKLRGPTNRFEFPSPYQLAWKKLKGQGGEMPSILDLVWRTSTISSEVESQQNEDRADLLIDPSLGDCGLFEFDRLEELREIGYRETRKNLRESSIF